MVDSYRELSFFSVFPQELEPVVRGLLLDLPKIKGPKHRVSAESSFILDDRLYNSEIPWYKHIFYSEVEKLILACLYSRHHDGHVRQKNVRVLLLAPEFWGVPFVLYRIGDYVVEILDDILNHMDRLKTDQMVYFCSQNPQFVGLLKSRIVSYWNCYYRQGYPVFADYPGYGIGRCLGWWG